MPQPISTISEESCKIKLTGIWLEIEFLKSRRCLEMMHDFGPESLYWLECIWGEIAESKATRLSKKSIEIVLAAHIQNGKLAAFLDYCVAESLLDVRDGFYTAGKLQKQKKKRAAEKSRKRSGKSAEKVRSAVLSLKSLIVDKKEVSDSDIEAVAECEYPDNFNFPALFDWLTYKREKGQNYKLIGLQQLIDKWKDKPPADFAAAVKHSTSNNYQGLFEPKAQSGPPGSGFKTFGELQREKTKQVFQQLREEEERNAKGAA